MPWQVELRVRYCETDAQGVVHHSAYVAWLEIARIEALRQAGYSYRQLEADGIFMPVVELQLQYQRPARFDDLVQLQTTVEAVGRVQLRFASRLCIGEELIATGQVQIASLDAQARPQAMPAAIVEALCRCP